jgi:hypothetical protein
MNALRAVPVLLLALALGGCALGSLRLQRGQDAAEHLEFLVEALTADSQRRESLWQATLKENPGEDASLRRALLRSVPGHSGYDLAAAEADLQALLAQSPSADVAPVARARLEDLRATNACRAEVDQLKRRLSKVADIERRLDRERR